ncbi:MAG: 1-deoxy-D-xylulose-5-phosphate synthase, partial [Eubacteriales bacterium]|nr:1-deoxy-D-xylulose-5-phosphate synthase [Eubacteriales bacterium]
MSKLLYGIKGPEDIRDLNYKQLTGLAAEIREFLVGKLSETGGHLASNLGVVELTIAIHRVFSTPIDKIVWDVGHQTYVHKILTGRLQQFDHLRKLGGVSGFPKTSESVHDFFNTGHSSTSISASLGMARARDLKGEKYSVISVIGDGALTGGMAFEALNDVGRSETDLIIILNDNEMSISRNVGGLSRHLSNIRSAPVYSKANTGINRIIGKIPVIGKWTIRAVKLLKGTLKYIISPGVIFEELGLKYLGPIDGHDIPELEKVLNRAKRMKGPVIIHVNTQKGKGYSYAEVNPPSYHGISPFEISTGQVKEKKTVSNTIVFGNEITKLAQEDKHIVAITAAMPSGTGLGEFSKSFPTRFFDVGIAEQHAVTFAAGMAKNGMKPVVAIYSSFLQRAYDQIMHDVAIQNLHVVLAIDRAGVVGEDGETHQGLYDISYLRHMPNMTIMAPADHFELRSMLRYALTEMNGPVAIRYTRGQGTYKIGEPVQIEYGKGVLLRKGSNVTIAAAGDMTAAALKAADLLAQSGCQAEVISARFLKPLDENLIIESVRKTHAIVTIENNSVSGGFGSGVLEILSKYDIDKRTL